MQNIETPSKTQEPSPIQDAINSTLFPGNTLTETINAVGECINILGKVPKKLQSRVPDISDRGEEKHLFFFRVTFSKNLNHDPHFMITKAWGCFCG